MTGGGPEAALSIPHLFLTLAAIGVVGLIFADIGRRSGVLSDTVFGAVLLMVMATTFIGPVALKAAFGRAGAMEPTQS